MIVFYTGDYIKTGEVTCLEVDHNFKSKHTGKVYKPADCAKTRAEAYDLCERHKAAKIKHMALSFASRIETVRRMPMPIVPEVVDGTATR